MKHRFSRRQFLQYAASSLSIAALGNLRLLLAKAQEVSGQVEIWGYGLPMLGHFEAAKPILEEKYPGLELVLRDFGYLELHANIANALVSGVGVPDIVNYDVSYVSDFAPALSDLTELFAPYQDDFVPVSLQLASSDGKLLGLPQDIEPMGLVYRADIFEEYGITEDDLATWDGFIEAGQKLWQDSNETIKMIAMDAPGSQMPVFGVPHQIHEVFMHLAGYHGVFFNKEDDRVIVDEDAAIEALEIFQRVCDTTVSWTLQTTDSSLAAYQSGLVATNICPAWFPLGLQLGLSDQSGNWRLMRLPALSDDGIRTAFQISTVTGIPLGAANPEAAWQTLFEGQLTTEAQYTFFETSGGVLPTRLDILDDLAQREIEYFDGQRIYNMFLEILADLPDVYFGRGWVEARSIMTSGIEPIVRQEVAAADGAAAIAEEMRRKLDKS